MGRALPIDDADKRDFEPTMPPQLCDGLASALRPMGVAEVSACIIDTDDDRVEGCWTITEQGTAATDLPPPDAEHGPHAAMATIVKLNSEAPFDAIVTRQLDPCRWVLAWRVDLHRVGVAVARFHDPVDRLGEADTRLMRMICDTGMRSPDSEAGESGAEDVDIDLLHSRARALDTDGTIVAAVGAGALTAPSSSVAPSQVSVSHGAAPRVRRPPGVRSTQRRAAFGLLALYAVVAVSVAALDYHTDRVLVEFERVQSLADATLLQRLGDSLAAGDYGEVQAEVDKFEALDYFGAAVVVNARGLVVAKSGMARDVRMGDPVSTEAATGARQLDLGAAGAPKGSLVLLWAANGATTADDQALADAQAWVPALGVAICAAATAAVGWRWRRQLRQRWRALRRSRGGAEGPITV